jgi:hypothetical protein
VPYPISFDKDTAERWLQALDAGKPIVPPDGRWSIHDMLALAGLGFFGALSHGPLRYKTDPGRLERLPAEHREATESTLFHELHMAMEFYARLTMDVKDGTFDDRYEPHVEAVVFRDQDEPVVQVVKGLRAESDEES